MTTNPQDTITKDDLSLQAPKQRGVFVKLFPDTNLSSDWYEGEFSIRGGFAKSYLIGLGEMVELGVAEKQSVSPAARDVLEIAKKLSKEDAEIFVKLGGILTGTKDNPKYNYVRRLLEVLASWPVHSEEAAQAPVMPMPPVAQAEETQEVTSQPAATD